MEHKCPKCGNTNLSRERCMNGHTICNKCGRKRKHSEFYTLEDTSNELFYQDKYDSKKFIDATAPGIIVAKGGDGTLLKAINKFRHLNKPFFGVGAGTLNFLMNDSEYLSDQAKYKKFSLIKVQVTFEDYSLYNDGKPPYGMPSIKTEEYQAFNEVLMGGDMNSWIEFNVHDKDAIIGKFKGGGVSISTAQGSTGFNMSNGGSVLPLSSDQWFVTSGFSKRDIRVPIEPKRTTITAESRTPVTVWIDGQNHIIKNVKKIEISKGDEVTVIFNDYDKFKRKRRV